MNKIPDEIEDLIKKEKISRDYIEFTINKRSNFYIPYKYFKYGQVLRKLEHIANMIGYKFIFKYNIKSEDLLRLERFAKMAIYYEVIERLPLQEINDFNFVKVGLVKSRDRIKNFAIIDASYIQNFL